MYNCIINTKDKEIIEHLTKLGYNCISTIKSNLVSEEISLHADVLYLKFDNKIIMSICQKDNSEIISNNGYTVELIDNLLPGYKTECLLNFIMTNDYIIKNNKTALNISTNKKVILTKQGYTRCSTAVINTSAFITEDTSIYKSLTENNLDCLLIEKGNVNLDGYNYGFIGGATIMLNDNILFFCGDVKNIKEKNKIIEFLYKYNVKPYFIEGKELEDIGSAVIL